MTVEAQLFRPLLQQVAVVTGASRGIGRALAAALAGAGCQLALCARHTKFLGEAELADRFEVPVLVAQCDVRVEESVSRFFASVRERYGRIDILINNAGVAVPLARVEQTSLADWQDALETNLTGTFLVTRAALPLMPRGSSIVNTLSIAAKRPFAGASAYVAAKHGAKGFTDTLREELREREIRVLALMPGATDTDLWNVYWPEAPRDRMMSPETVAQAVVHALTLPAGAGVEELVLAPVSGSL